jgi:hypothetical protein
MLEAMSPSNVWVKILENEEDAKKIEENFKCMDEHTKNFQVRVAYYMLMQSSSARNCAEH